ncbi:TPA: hypothetical protein ACX6R5_000260 [Photobacterium damselae]
MKQAEQHLLKDIEASLWAKHASKSLYIERLGDTSLPTLLSGEIELNLAEVNAND